MNQWTRIKIDRYRDKIDDLVEAGEWSRALTTVIDFAQWADGTVDDPELWLEMTVSATRIVGHLEDPAEYRAFLTHFAAPFLGDDDRPRAGLMEAFASIADHAEPSVMVSIGRWLTDARSDWPLGPYLMAHFGEIGLRDGDTGLDPETVADHFELTARRAHRLEDRHWELHATLRRGAVLTITGADRRTGHDILGTLDWSRLAPHDQLWMAVALAGSVHWTDRLRAMDILLDLRAALSRTPETERGPTLEDLRRAASTIFRLAGLDLPEAEERRLEQLSETLFAGEQKREWTRFLSSRRRLSKVSSLPFDQSDEVRPHLEKLRAVHPDRWEPAARRFEILRAGWSGEYRSTPGVPSRRDGDHRLPIADLVGRILDRLEAADDGTDDAGESLEDLVEQLVETLNGLRTDGDGSAARPVALIWPRLLARASALNLGDNGAVLTRLARRHTDVAPPPGYGWWTLAAHLYDAGLDEAAAVVADCALATGTDGTDEEVRGWVATKTFERAVDRTDTAEARRWLEELPA